MGSVLGSRSNRLCQAPTRLISVAQPRRTPPELQCATTHRAIRHLGLQRLSLVRELVHRYERQLSGELVQVDAKKLASLKHTSTATHSYSSFGLHGGRNHS